ncbi:RRXRR domain-containing protein [Anoxybacillus flavithermus]
MDYGSRHTGLAILRGQEVVWLGQLDHRTDIKERIDKRRAFRRADCPSLVFTICFRFPNPS